MTFRDNQHVTLTPRDWTKLAAAMLLQLVLVIGASYLGTSIKINVIEAELRATRELFDTKLDHHRLALAEVKADVGELRRAKGP